jgi:flagellar biosynthesis GTPase FlhF
MSSTPEQQPINQESSVETPHSAAERLDNLHENLENSNEQSARDVDLAEQARQKALETAISKEFKGKVVEKIKEQVPHPPHRSNQIDKKKLKESFKQTMTDMQTELSPGSRAFSKVIHNPIVETASDIIGETVARPNSILAGAFMAFALTLSTYLLAKRLGYALSGFETIAAFIIGWIIGAIYDYFKVLFTGKKS